MPCANACPEDCRPASPAKPAGRPGPVQRAGLLSPLLAALVLSLSAGDAEAQAAPSPAAPSAATAKAARTPWRCEHGMQALLERFAQLRNSAAHFTEEKLIALLGAPLRSEGSVEFAAPDVLLRLQERPRPAAMLLEGTKVHFQDDTGRRSLELSKWDAAEGIVSGYLKVLQGDASGLQRHYTPKFNCEEHAWTLVLIPKSASLKRLLQRMELRGEGTRLTRSEMVDVHGDRTVTTFTAHSHRPDGGAAERTRLRKRFDGAVPASGHR